jgi:hypothetical protein
MLDVEYAPVTPQALLLCFKLQLRESRMAIVSSTVVVMLGQLVMFAIDDLKVVKEDRHLLLTSELESITLLDAAGTVLPSSVFLWSSALMC